MSFSRIAIATAIVVASLAAGGPGTQPATTSGGLVGSLPQLVISHRPTPQTPAAPAIYITTIHAETDEQHATAEWALNQMAAAGFELPPVTIYMHSSRTDCAMQPGAESNGYFMQRDGENIVHVCGNRWILLHELAHVWDKNSLDDATRQLIIEHQGLESWSHSEWDQAAGEHLASIIAWAIEGTHPRSIGYYDQAHIAAAYELATGNVPPILATDIGSAASAPMTETAGTPDTDLM